MWFFKKREEPRPAYSEEIARINTNLKHSFLKIKEDIKTIKAWIEYFENQHKDHKLKFKHLENRLTHLDEMLSYSVLAPKKVERKVREVEEELSEEVEEILEQAPHPTYLKLLEDLTETQKTIFYRLALLLRESGQEWITIKNLATDLYPNKPYDQVRSTASEYVNILIESGLLEKRRRGKHTYVAVTEKGKKLVEKTQKEVAQKIKTRARR